MNVAQIVIIASVLTSSLSFASEKPSVGSSRENVISLSDKDIGGKGIET